LQHDIIDILHHLVYSFTDEEYAECLSSSNLRQQLAFAQEFIAEYHCDLVTAL